MASDLRVDRIPLDPDPPETAGEDLTRLARQSHEPTSIGLLGDLLESWSWHLRASNLSRRTIQSYLEAGGRLVQFLEASGMPAEASLVTRRNLEAFVAHLLTEHSAATAANRYRSLQQLFRWLEDEGEIPTSPMRRMRAPAVPEKPVPVIQPTALRQLVKACSGTSLADRRDLAILLVFIDTGARLAEVASLRLTDDLDLRERALYVNGKGRRPRVLPLGNRTVRELDRYVRVRARSSFADEEHLWLGRKGPLSASGISQMIKRRSKEAGLPSIHPHQFRHTFASEWLRAGGNETDLMRIAGWRTREMLDRYGAAEAARRAREAHASRSPADNL